VTGLAAITEREAGFVEGYAKALETVMLQLTGDCFSAKSYDPMTVDLRAGVMHSYAFNLKDGGRHHPLADYASVAEICDYLAGETVDYLRANDTRRMAETAQTGSVRSTGSVVPQGGAQTSRETR
jgi:hypothetical protein